jgi:hypothetical protein
MADQATIQPMLDYHLEYLFTRETKTRRELIGPVPEGIRLNIYTEGGEVYGPVLNGTCGVGGDWLTIRKDGVGVVDSRVMIETDDGALVYMYYTGLVDLGADAYEQILRGERPTPGKIHTVPRFQTAAPRYLWLNRIQALGIGESRITPAGEGRNVWETYAIR